MEAPTSLEKIWQRKERARRRFAESPLAEQIDQMNRHRRELDQTFGRKRNKAFEADALQGEDSEAAR